MRIVSLLELFVSFRLHRGGDPLCVAVGEVDRYSSITLARDFAFFKKVLSALEFATAPHWVYGSVDLSQVNIFPLQRGLWIGWPSDLEVSTLVALREFVGRRPVTSAQGLTRPWKV